MGAIPGRVSRGKRVRCDLSYVPFGTATWRWWCAKHGVELLVLDRPVDGPLGGAAPPVQRWFLVNEVLKHTREPVRAAVIDADTMIRWDAPDFFEPDGGNAVSAVCAGNPGWIWHSLRAYARFFPGVDLDWWNYFNSGLVVLTPSHAPLLDGFLQFYQQHEAELEAIQQSGDFGVDQTLLNYFVARERIPIRALPPVFNLLHCFKLPARVQVKCETLADNSDPRLLDELFHTPGAFDFIKYAFIWHFTSTVLTRATVMRETWRRIRAHYRGGGVPDPLLDATSVST
jgi:hypothetical protein